MRSWLCAASERITTDSHSPLTFSLLALWRVWALLGVLCARRQTDSVRYPRSRWATECICAALRGALHMYREGHVNGAAEGRLRKGRRGDADDNAWKTERAWACVEKSGGY